MEIIALMFVALTSSFLLGELFHKFNMPKVLGPIIFGLLFSQEPLSRIFLAGSTIEIFDFIKDIAIIFLLFFVGLKIDLREFRKTSKRSIFVGVLASLIPFLLGFLAVIFLNMAGAFDYFMASGDSIFIVALVVGICLSLTAEGVIIEILEELGLIKTVVGETIIEAGIIDDIIGIILLSILVALVPGGFGDVGYTGPVGVVIMKKLIDMVIFLGIISVLGYFIVPIIMKSIEKEKSTISFFAVSIMITLFLAVVTQYFNLGGSILGALFGGVIIRHTLLSGDGFERKEERYITDIIEVTTFGFFAPFFFIWIGLNVNLSIFLAVPGYALLFILLALGGKMVGSFVGNIMAGGRRWEGIVIGWAMNTRSEVEIMIATLALSAGVVSVNLFSLIILTSFVATVISPIFFQKLMKKHHGV